MQSAKLKVAGDTAAPPRTVWRTPEGVPCFSTPSPLGSLWRRGRRLLARLRRAVG